MNILFVTENLPYPLDRGGYIRSSYLLRELCRYHEVTLLASREPASDRAGVEYYKNFCREVICLPKPAVSPLKKCFYLLGGLSGEKPYPINKNFNPQFLRTINEELKSGGYQALHCDHLDAAQYLACLDNPPKSVFDTHNLLSLLIERLARQETSLAKRTYINSQARKFKAYEARICELFDQCLVCSEQDKEQLLYLAPKAKAEIIPNGVDMGYYRVGPDPPEVPTLLFVGSLAYLPNSRGVLDFYHNVWPLVRGRIPQARWRIVGQNPPPAIQELAKDGAVSVITDANDMRPFLAGSTLAVVPLRIGGGTRLKILEAMAAGVPVVSTSVGAEGIDAVDGKEIIIADEPQVMARQIVKFCGDSGLRERLARDARKFVSRYDWEAVGKKLLLCYNYI